MELDLIRIINYIQQLKQSSEEKIIGVEFTTRL